MLPAGRCWIGLGLNPAGVEFSGSVNFLMNGTAFVCVLFNFQLLFLHPFFFCSLLTGPSLSLVFNFYILILLCLSLVIKHAM